MDPRGVGAVQLLPRSALSTGRNAALDELELERELELEMECGVPLEFQLILEF